MRQPNDPETTHFKQPGERLRCARDAIGDLDLIVRDKNEAPADQTQGQIGFASAWRTNQQNARAIARHTCAVTPSVATHGAASARHVNDAPHAPVMATGRITCTLAPWAGDASPRISPGSHKAPTSL